MASAAVNVVAMMNTVTTVSWMVVRILAKGLFIEGVTVSVNRLLQNKAHGAQSSREFVANCELPHASSAAKTIAAGLTRYIVNTLKPVTEFKLIVRGNDVWAAGYSLNI